MEKIAHRRARITAAFTLEKEAILISNGKIVTQVEHHGVQYLLGEKTGKIANVNCNITLPFRSLPGATDHPTRTQFVSLNSHMNSFHYGEFFELVLACKKKIEANLEW